MGLLDWLRGGKQAEEPSKGDSVDERSEARREEKSGAAADSTDTVDPALQRRDEEAGRHSGI
jgi:hypothetical protein